MLHSGSGSGSGTFAAPTVTESKYSHSPLKIPRLELKIEIPLNKEKARFLKDNLIYPKKHTINIPPRFYPKGVVAIY